MRTTPSSAFRPSPEPGAENWVSLSFPVTWRFLSEYGAPTEIEQKVERKQTPPPPRLQEVVKATAVIPPIPAPGPSPGPNNDTWEMVIPRMSRPEKRPVAPVAVDPPKAVKPEPAHPHTKIVESSSPAFSAVAEPVPPKIPVFALVAVGAVLMGGMVFFLGGSAVLGGSARGAATVQASPLLPVGVAGWTVVSEWPRRISLLRGYSDLADFRMEFAGAINTRALGWVFGATDARNYYAMKLEIVTPGRDPVVVLKRFAVVNGRDQDVVQIPLPATARLDTLYKVRLEALGDRITTWVQDRQVDQWTVPALSKGAIGLFNDPAERGTIEGDVKVFHLERK